MKKFLATLLTAGMILQSLVVGVMPVQAAQNSDDATKYVTLDGEWHYKLYRTYPNMFQYFPYTGVRVKWEDVEAAKVPSASTWQSWEVMQMPSDNAETGGLLANNRPTPAVDTAAEEVEESEITEIESVESESAEAESVESESAETESVESESAETESIESEGTEAESIESEGTEAESIESEGTETESIESEITETEDVQAAIEANDVQVLNDTVAPLADDGYDETWLCPTWSEAWVCRSFTLPADFTTDDTVTLLMGIIDDNDVIYINGQAVAASGFVDGNGNPTLNIPATGGFDYKAADKAAQVKWSKSYWEIEREYEIPSSVLNLGGTNEICVRLYNNNSNGGFYSGKIYALCGNESAVRSLKGLPTEKTESEEVNEIVQAQIDALAAGDIDAYAATISENYHDDAAVKEDAVADVKAMMDKYSDIKVTDTNSSVYVDEGGVYWYSANRVITGVNKETGAEETISSSVVESYYEVTDEGALERGNWNRCYGTSYDSELFGEALTYSVYLPPSYYENTDRSYPVVWLLHGRASSSTSYRDVDGIGSFMDNQINSGNIEEMILIMPDSGKYAFYSDSELKPGDKDNSGPWRTQLTSELRTETQSKYRMLTDAKFNGLTGNSMGGYGSAVVGATNPDLYSSIAVHMGYLPNDAQEAIKGLSEEQLEVYDFYLDAGLQDTTVGYKNTVALHEYLDSVGKEHGYDLRDGIHGSAFYMQGMPASMKMHSDHFLKMGLYDAEVGATEGTFDKNEASANNKAITIPVDLNGNVIKSIDGLTEDDYEITEEGIVLHTKWLNSLEKDTVLTIYLFSGKSFTYTVKVVETPTETDQPDETETDQPDETETDKPADTSKPNKPNKPSSDSVQTGDEFNLTLIVGIFIGSMLVAAALVMVLMRRRAEK